MAVTDYPDRPIYVKGKCICVYCGLHLGEVINRVDGKSVRTPMEFAGELANRPEGDKVRLGYLIHGAWQTETAVLLAH